jgi:hypothetical protein
MNATLRTLSQAQSLIEQGKHLLVAGDEALLAKLPRGSWIGGTIPYFVADAGGVTTADELFVTELPPSVTGVSIETYGPDTLRNVYADAAGDAFALILLPAGSRTALEFALHAPEFPSFAVRPLVGWVTGVHLSQLGKVTPKVFDGRTGGSHADAAMVMRVRLSPGLVAETGTVNVFDQGTGPDLEFAANGYSAREIKVRGELRPIVPYMKEAGIDPAFPLVADYLGARVNVSIQAIDEQAGEVRFYAPVFAGVKYRAAAPVADVAGEFLNRLPKVQEERLLFSCNCILNYEALQGRRTGVFKGPVTFGEVAYQLLNQTLVYVTIEDEAAR